MVQEVLRKRFKNEAVAVYDIVSSEEEPSSPLNRYVISTNGTRNLINFPEILNRNFTDEMVRGLTYGLVGIDRLENLSTISSKHVNVFHLLRGSLNFRLVRALRDAFGYKWHSSSFVSSQRVKIGEEWDVEDDAYRKFVIPDKPTIYVGDIVATGVSIDNALKYLSRYCIQRQIDLQNFVLVTIGCKRIEPVLERWHRVFKERFSSYDRSIVIYLEGRFGLASPQSNLRVLHPETDLLRQVEAGSLHTPEFEFSQFQKTEVPLEGCVIYDGGKKSFEPMNHFEEIRSFWQAQHQWARAEDAVLWEEYNQRFSLRDYFADFDAGILGSPEALAEARLRMWRGLEEEDYERLFRRFEWFWTPARIQAAQQPGSFAPVCLKKLVNLERHLMDDVG